MSDFIYNFLEFIENVVDEVQKNDRNNRIPSQRMNQPLSTSQNQIGGTVEKTKDLPPARTVKTKEEKEAKATPPKLKEPVKPLTMQNQDDYVVPDFPNISSKDILNGIVFSEILGKPKALRRYK